MTEPPTPKPRRRWFALSLRALMVAVLVVGGGLGWLARRAHLQRRAVAAIERLQGTVAYDWQWDGVSPAGIGGRIEPPGPAWLRRIVGDEYFQDVAMVFLPNYGRIATTAAKDDAETDVDWWARVADDQLTCLDGLDRIESLQFYNCQFKPGAWPRLERMVHLRWLGLCPIDDTRDPTDDINPADLNRLGALVNLEELTLAAHPRTDADLAFLDRLPKLHSLWFLYSKIDDAGLVRIGRRVRLKNLMFHGPELSDAGLAPLAGLNLLENLTIKSAAGLTDAGLTYLTRLPALKTLDLPDTPVSEEMLAALAQLPKLTEIKFRADLVCQPTLTAIRAARPGLTLFEVWPR